MRTARTVCTAEGPNHGANRRARPIDGERVGPDRPVRNGCRQDVRAQLHLPRSEARGGHRAPSRFAPHSVAAALHPACPRLQRTCRSTQPSTVHTRCTTPTPPRFPMGAFTRYPCRNAGSAGPSSAATMWAVAADRGRHRGPSAVATCRRSDLHVGKRSADIPMLEPCCHRCHRK